MRNLATAFKTPQHKPNAITLARGTLNRCLFMGGHYETDKHGNSFFQSNATHISLKSDDISSLTVECITTIRGCSELITLTFEKDAQNSALLNFSGGTSVRNGIETPVNDPERVADLLSCIYRQVRQEVDPKWQTAINESVSDSLSGGVCVSMIPASELAEKTGRMPVITADKNRKITYTPPIIGPDKVCKGNCGKCGVNFALP
jgi:hypothetical protein